MLVIKPFIIAKVIIPNTGKGIFDIWKNKIVPKSPIAQPKTHQAVFLALVFHVCLQFQLKFAVVSIRCIYFIYSNFQWVIFLYLIKTTLLQRDNER